MITRVAGKLLTRELDRVEVMTASGLAYEIAIPRTAFEKLPKLGASVEMRTHQVVREDGIFLYGFLDEPEKIVFTRLLTASGVGPRLALSLLSALPAARLVRAIREKDLATLSGVSGVGKRTAERLCLDLATKLDDVPVVVESRPTGPGIEEALQALAVFGYPPAEAEKAVRAVARENGDLGVQDLIKAALAKLK